MSDTPDLARMREVAEKAATRLTEWLDDFDRDNADDHDNDDFEVGQDELIEVPAEALRAILAAQRPLLDRIAELEGERDSWRAHAEHHFGHMRAALDLSYALRYPADPTLLDLIADEITCDDRCENAWREHDTNACGCTKSDREEGCAWEKAQALRDLAKAIRDQAWLLAFSPPSPALAAEAQVSALQAQVDGLREAVKDACDLLAERTYGSRARSPGHNARLRLEAALPQQGGA